MSHPVISRLVLPSVLALALSLGACSSESSDGDARVAAAVARIDAKAIKEDIRLLSADEMEGRGPGTLGAARARDHLIAELEKAGATPGAGGGWTQDVPLRRVESSEASLKLEAGEERWEPRSGRDYVLGSLRGPGLHRARGEVVFVGHGVQAPEYEWDDFKGLDCRGKILVMLVGDPPAEDPNLFGGPAMTYYGRWTYKYEKAAELGAAACFVVHRTSWAGYGWPVVFNSFTRPRMDVRGEDPNARYRLRGWLTWEAAERLVERTGKSLEDLAAAASRPDFQPVSLGWTAEVSCVNKTAPVEDSNVVGVFEGGERKDEWIVFTAHYDHLGVNEAEERAGRDGIYNGAIDNASGCAGLLAVARAWGALDPPPARSAMFLFVGSEEQGLLGSRWYSENPLAPPAKTVCNVNIDGLNVHEPTSDLEVIGSGQSDLEERLQAVLAEMGRRILPDTESEKGYYYRSDHFNFARIGIPALYVKTGKDVPGRPEGWMRERSDDWRVNHYHRPSDEFDPAWPCTGAAADAEAIFRTALRLADGEEWPAWSETSEFREVSRRLRGR